MAITYNLVKMVFIPYVPLKKEKMLVVPGIGINTQVVHVILIHINIHINSVKNWNKSGRGPDVMGNNQKY